VKENQENTTAPDVADTIPSVLITTTCRGSLKMIQSKLLAAGDITEGIG
jgi:hypothetical protein